MHWERSYFAMNKPNIAVASLIYGDPSIPGFNYTNAVLRAGGRPFMVSNVDSAEEAQYIYDHFDGLLLTGGCDLTGKTLGVPAHPEAECVPQERDDTEILLARTFMAGDKPILAIWAARTASISSTGRRSISSIRTSSRATVYSSSPIRCFPPSSAGRTRCASTPRIIRRWKPSRRSLRWMR